MSILSEGNNFGINEKKMPGKHLGRCVVCGDGSRKFTFYVEETSPEVKSYLYSLGYGTWDSICPKCLRNAETRVEPIKEDFSMGVEGPLGLNQGIPHGGPGKGVLPKPLYNPKAKAVTPTKKVDNDTEKNKKEMEKSLNKKPVSESKLVKLSKNCQLFIRKTDGSKSRLQFVSPAEARNSRALIDLVSEYTSDWVELWTERYELDDDGYATKTIEGKHIDNPKKVSEKKKCCHGHNRLEEDAKEDYKTALNLLRCLHYQVYNGGIEQCAFNGYLDDLEDYGTNQFIADLRREIDVSTDAGAECLKAAQMFVDVLDEVSMTRRCPDCGGEGQTEEEDEYGDIEYSNCSYCNGEGTVDVDSYSDADFDDFVNSWYDIWNKKYYKLNGDLIDDATGQTHTHSVVLDALRAAPKNESTTVRVDPFNDFLEKVDRYLYKAGYEPEEIVDYIADHYAKLRTAFYKGKSPVEVINSI